MKKRYDRYVSARTIYTAIPPYPSIPCALPRVCRRNLWVRILLSPSYSSSFFFFLYLFPFFTLLYTNYHWWGLFVILSKYIHMRSCFGGFLLKGIQWCNQNLICFFIFELKQWGPPLDVMVLVGCWGDMVACWENSLMGSSYIGVTDYHSWPGNYDIINLQHIC
jgi:hypothetical protein